MNSWSTTGHEVDRSGEALVSRCAWQQGRKGEEGGQEERMVVTGDSTRGLLPPAPYAHHTNLCHRTPYIKVIVHIKYIEY